MTTSDTGLPADLPGFDDPVELLRACHSKMQQHCDLLDRMIERGTIDTEAREAARNISRYFTQSAPLHHRDEEEDLFPRINRQSLKIAELVHTLKKEHEILDGLWQTMAAVLKRLPEDGFDADFRRAAAEFTALNRQHIQRENSELLPLASNSLSEDVLKQIGEAMARRRGVRYSAL